MIATLTGTVTHKLETSLVIEINGIGYEVLTIVDDWGSAKVGSEMSFHIYEQIREDAHNLYGFTDLRAKELFIKLLSVNGVGPKVALATLSAAGVDRLSQAIASGDTGLLKGISGVGKKTAERLLLELKGKLGAELPLAAGGAAVGEAARLRGLASRAAERPATEGRAGGCRSDAVAPWMAA